MFFEQRFGLPAEYTALSLELFRILNLLKSGLKMLLSLFDAKLTLECNIKMGKNRKSFLLMILTRRSVRSICRGRYVSAVSFFLIFDEHSLLRSDHKKCSLYFCVHISLEYVRLGQFSL